MSQGSLEVVVAEYFELKKSYPYLELSQSGEDFELKGTLYFSASFNGDHSINDVFKISILVPSSYPLKLPTTKEIGGRIPRRFHTNPDKTLCLGAPLALKIAMIENKSLKGYVEKLVIPFLYSYSFFEKYGKLPYGELAHGTKGIMDYYQDLFKLPKNGHVPAILKFLVSGKYRGHHMCPCGSELRLRNCHGQHFLYMMEFLGPKAFIEDYEYCKRYLPNLNRGS